MKTRLLFSFTFFGLYLLLNLPIAGQNSVVHLTLEDIYKNGTYRQKGYGPIQWTYDNKGYFTLEKNTKYGGSDIVRYNLKTGKRSVVVSAKQLIPVGKNKPLIISNYKWSADNTKLLIFTNTRKVWRYHTRGDYWVFDIKTNKLCQLGRSVERATMMFAKFSPDGKKVAYVSKYNLYVENLTTGKITKITFDGGNNIINGTFDWVYEEELSDRDGFRWSPDSKYIVYWQSNTKGVGTFYLINNIDSIYPRLIPIKYPKVGTQNSAVKIGVVSAEGGKTRWFNIPGDPRNHYLARMDFIPESDEVIIQQLNRLQNTNKIWIGNIVTMKLNNVLIEKDDAFLDIKANNKIIWYDHNKYFLWVSERDGWRHLYKVSRDGEEMTLITKGDFDIVTIAGIDSKEGYVYYIASPKNYTQRYLYRSHISGKGKSERITPSEITGNNSYQISPNAKWAIHTFQNVTTPPIISLVNLPEHKNIRILEDNYVLKEKIDSLRLRPKEFFKVDIGDVVLDAWMIKPVKFDPSKKYPVIFYVYGEPAGSTVQDTWNGGDLWHQYMAQQGYIIMSIDNRGTNVPRGREWRKCIYRQIGILASHDQAEAVRKICSMFNYVDAKRIGIWGWSGGGQMTLNCLFRYPEIYNTGIAVAFVSDQKLYDDIYQERYMGLLDDNEKGYKNGSPINFVHNLKGNLMIIAGTGDDNVHYQNLEMLVNELIKENKIFSMMSYPMRSHGIYERANTSYHLRETMEWFWKNNLIPGGK